jgi:hypothetical protein
MIELVFLLEEPSAKAMIEGILRKIILEANIVVRYIVFEGKQDLEKQITPENDIAKFQYLDFELSLIDIYQDVNLADQE